MSPDGAPISLTDRYMDDYKKRLVDSESKITATCTDQSGASSDLDIQDDEIIVFPSDVL